MDRRKILRSLLLLSGAIPLNVLAEGLPSIGVYGGLGMGGIFGQHHVNISTSAPAPTPPFSTGISGNFINGHKFKPQGTVFLGVGFCNDFYFGGELSGTFGKKPTSTSTLAGTSIASNIFVRTFTKTYLNSAEFALDGRFGILINPCSMLYLKMGSGLNKTTIHFNSNFVTTGLLSTAFENTVSKRKFGLRIGAGFEQAIENDWFVRGEYVYTLHGKLASTATVTSPTLGLLNNTTVVRFRTHRVMPKPRV